MDEGIALAGELMRGINESLAKSSASALFSVICQRAWLRMRGYGFTQLAVQTPPQTPNAENRRVEIRRR